MPNLLQFFKLTGRKYVPAEEVPALMLQNPSNDPVLAKCDAFGQLRVVAAQAIDVVALTFSADTSILADGDIIADTQEVAGAVRLAGGPGLLDSIVLVDKDDQKIAMDLVFLSSNTSLGTENSAPNISDANALNVLGIINIATGDYVDLGGVSVATKRSLNLPIEAATGSTSIYVAAITRGGTPTYTAAGLVVRLGFR